MSWRLTARTGGGTLFRWYRRRRDRSRSAPVAATCIILLAACSTIEPADTTPGTADPSPASAPSPSVETEPQAGIANAGDERSVHRETEPTVPGGSESGAGPSAIPEDGAAAEDGAAVDGDQDSESETPLVPRLEPPPLEVSDVRAPTWPFRGVVQAFVTDVDANGFSDLLLQFHDSTNRSSREILIQNLGSAQNRTYAVRACRPGIRYNERELWVEGLQGGYVIPWGGVATVSDRAGHIQRLSETWVSTDEEQLAMAGTRFSASARGTDAWIIADGTEGQYQASVEVSGDSPGQSNSAVRRGEPELRFRGTDGELLAMTYAVDGRPSCTDQRTAVISLRTGQLLACGQHAGDIEFVTPPGEGLAVDEVVLPTGDKLMFDGCDTSLKQQSFTENVEGGFFEQLAGLPALTELRGPRCHPVADKDPRVSGGTMPLAPFYGAVLALSSYEPVCEEHRIKVHVHDARTRRTSTFTVANLQQLPCASHIRASEHGIELLGHQLVDENRREGTQYFRLELRWGQPPVVSSAGVFAGSPSRSHFSATPRLAWFDVEQIGDSRISIQSHTNGVRLSVGEETRGYALGRGGSDAPPVQQALMGRYSLSRSYTGLNGTDGEHLAFTWRSSSDDCTPKAVYGLSMRTGELLACGTLESGDLLLVVPAEGGLKVDEIELADSGWLNRSNCASGIDAGLLRALEALPSASGSLTDRPPSQALLPTDAAPAWPFRGVVRAYERYDAVSFQSDLAVQFYDTAAGTLSEVVFEESALAGWKHDFFVAMRGVAVAQNPDSGERLVVPWGEVPRLVAEHAVAQNGWRPMPVALARYATLLTLGDANLDIGAYEPWPGGVIGLSYGAQERWYLTKPVPPDAPVQPEVEIGERGPAWTAHFRGSDGSVLAFTYLAEYSASCAPACGLELTYLVSLTNGDILTCGVEPSYSRIAFVNTAGDGATLDEVVLPPSGWLDPEPCLAGELAGDRGCSILLRESEPSDRCIREFDLRSIAEAINGAAVHPAGVVAHTRD